jgi:hypothetical protein
MKKMLFIILIAAGSLSAQVFDNPIGLTKHYGFRKYAQSAHVPNTVLNNDKVAIDSVMYSLIVYVDTTQFVIKDTTLMISNRANGTHSFASTSSVDSVFIDSTFQTTDNVFLQPLGSSYNVNDILFLYKKKYKIIVHRNTSGTSGLSYEWYWIKRY